jgi:hypothetical protein
MGTLFAQLKRLPPLSKRNIGAVDPCRRSAAFGRGGCDVQVDIISEDGLAGRIDPCEYQELFVTNLLQFVAATELSRGVDSSLRIRYLSAPCCVRDNQEMRWF